MNQSDTEERIAQFTTNLKRSSDGIWTACDNHQVSYPDSGNEDCFAVEEGSFWFCHRNRIIQYLVHKYSPSSLFFDIGGGNGCVSHALQTAGIDVVLVEPGPSGALNGKKRGVRNVIQSTLESAGFARESLPSVGLFDVVEHIENDGDFLRQIYDVMQPQGTLYVTVPALKSLWSNDDVYAGHFRRYTTNSLSRQLTQCGYKVRYCSYLFSFLVPPIFLLRAIPSWTGHRKSVSLGATRNEHSSGTGLVNSIVQRMLDAEFNQVKNGRSIWFGSSCIAVATKEDNKVTSTDHKQ